MKHFIILASVLFFTVGCTSMKALPGKIPNSKGELKQAYISTSTVKDSLDRSVTATQISVETGEKEADGTLELEQIAIETTTGPTVGGQMAIGATQGLGVGLTQVWGADKLARAKVKAAKIGASAIACPPGATNCHSTVTNNVVEGSGANVVVDADVNSAANAELIESDNFNSCPSGGCMLLPMNNMD